ncbi:MAG: phytase [Sphingorhabdus sp.]
MQKLAMVIFLAAASPATAQDEVEIPVEQLIAAALPAKAVKAKAETTPVATFDDAADDPAIWKHPTDPAKSLIVGTDKRAGIHVYDMAGKAVSFTPSPRLNNVDLRPDVKVNGKPAVLVVASDRRDEMNAAIALFTLDTEARKLVPLVNLPVGPGEAYGMCLWERKGDGRIYAFLVLKDGRIDQVELNLAGATATGKVVRSMKLDTQSEGCVVDDRTGRLYVAEEDVGLWRFDAKPSGSTKPKALGRADGKRLVADAEGLAIAPAGRNGGYLLASSQGDYAYALYRLRDGRYLGRFRIADGMVDGAQETDGLELHLGNFGPDYPAGLLVVQDGDNAPETQNFKYISWADVLKALF